MEIAETKAIFSIPLVLWKKIFCYCFYNNNNGKIQYRISREDGVFIWFVALKSTSKQLNLLLDDDFFLEAVKWIGLHRVFQKKKIRHLIKRGAYDAFKTFFGKIPGLTASSVFTGLLPLVVHYTDLHFLTEFMKDKHQSVGFTPHSVISALRRANERESNDMMLILWPIFVGIFRYNLRTNTIDVLTNALHSGRKLSFDPIVGFDEWILHRKKQSDDKILDLLLPTKRPAVIQIPEGSLLHLKYLNSTMHFKRRWSSMCIRDYKNPESCKIVYHEKYSRDEHEILIKKETSTNDVKYSYEGVTTRNLYELIIKTIIAEKLYGTYPHSYVALTKEALDLPFDEQPWFVGLLSTEEVHYLAAGAPNRTSFFIYCDHNGDTFIKWSDTGVLGSTVKIFPECEKISKHLPPNDIIFGISNYQHQESIKKYKAAKLIAEGKLEKLKQYIEENNMDLSKITDPNLIHYCVAQPKVHEEMLLWLLKNSPLETNASGLFSIPTYTEMKICDKCSEDTIRKFVAMKETTLQGLVECLLLKKRPFDVLNLAVQKLIVGSKHDYVRIMAKICFAVHLGLKYAEDYTKRVLVMMAWKYGNEDNYFKLLPKELINQILNYEYIDEPLYFQLLEHLASEIKNEDYYSIAAIENGVIEPFMRFWWKNWDLWYTKKTARILAKSIARAKNLSPDVASKLLNWFKRMVITGKLPTSTNIDDGNSEILPLVLYCLESSEKDATEVLGLLLKHKMIQRGNLLLRKPHFHNKWVQIFIPTTWIAVLNKNLNTIKLLIEEDLMPDRAEGIPGHEPMSLSDLCEKFPGTLDSVIEFINQCKRNKY